MAFLPGLQQEAEAEKVHEILGSGTSFSCKPRELDEKAVGKLHEINLMDRDAMEVHTSLLHKDPRDMPGEFFLSDDLLISPLLCGAPNDQWKIHGLAFAHAIWHPELGYRGLKMTYIYHKGNHKTNWIMNAYFLIHENSFLKTSDIVLCHVFQSDGYDPRPKRVPKVSDFTQIALNSFAADLEDLINDPKAFIDLDKYDRNCGAIVNGGNGKRSDAWNNFMGIKVQDPDGVVVLTLAICHSCSMVYRTGNGGSNNGTKTLNKHSRKCGGQHHIAENPQ